MIQEIEAPPVVWAEGLVETPRATGFDNLVLLTRRIEASEHGRGGTLYAYVPTHDAKGRRIQEYRSFAFVDRRRVVYGMTESGDVVQIAVMYLAGRSDAGMRHGRRWGRCR